MTAFDPHAAWDGGVLVSARFGDIYGSRQGALAQSRAVFLAGCGLPGAWAGRRRFTVGELGFGTGLNMLAVLHAWRDTRPAGATLHLFSVEGFPLAKADAAQALSALPELAGLAGPLLAQWPDGARGMHRIAWPELAAVLDLAVADVADALSGWDGQADAWFMDGFSPAKNPAMWTADLLAAVARATVPGGRAATWSVAGAVREGLAAGGFAVTRQRGFGAKSERLEAVMPGVAPEAAAPRVAILGAGIAGASLAVALRELGLLARVFGDGPMASGNPAALVSPRLAAGSGAGAALHAQAFRHAVQQIGRVAPEAVIARGALHLLNGAGELARAEATVASGLFAPESLALRDGNLWMADALVVNPDRLRAAWLPVVEPLAVSQVLRDAQGWWLVGAETRIGPFDALCLAAGFGTAELSGLPLRAVRGQVTLADISLEGPPTSWGGYVIPTDTGLLFGATHGRGDCDPAVRGDDQHRNLEGLARTMPELAARLGERRLGAAAGVRAAAGDHQPVAGALGDGLFVLGGLGGRGFTLAPLLGAHVAALIAGVASPLPLPLVALADPQRFRPARQTHRPKGDVSTGRQASPSAAGP